MGKLAPKPKTAETKKAASPAASDPIRNLSRRPMSQMVVVVHGKMAAGKTFFAASASEFWPEKLPAKPAIELSDMLWLQADRGACDGFRHNGLDVPIFDFVEFMSNEDIWRAAVDIRGQRYAQQPTIIQAMEYATGLVRRRYREGLTKWVVIDTLTTVDTHMIAHHQEITQGHQNKYEAYGRNLTAHRLFHTRMCATGCNIILLCHSKSAGDEKLESEQKKALTVQVSGDASFFPDLTGQAPKIYKHDDTLQLVVKASVEPKTKKLVRRVLVGHDTEGGEVKNRFEGLLDDVEEFNLRNILIKAGWTTGDNKS